MIRALIAATSLVAIAVLARDAGACSCMPPEPQLISPLRSQDVPANAKIRIELPSYGTPPQVVVRVHGTEQKIDVRSRKIGGRMLDVVELTPTAPLAASTQYEIATHDSERHPPTHVLGSFTTAASATIDTTAPRIDRIGAVFAEKTGHLGNSCSVPGPWILANDITASDPGRASAYLVYGIWLGDNAGNIDATKPPTRILQNTGTSLVIGQASSCHFHDFPIPTTPFVWIGIGAIDEAGNQSALKKVRVDLAGAKTPP